MVNKFLSTNNHLKTVRLAHALADIWIATEDKKDSDYHYGGTRMVSPSMSDSEVSNVLQELAWFESGLKNRLINRCLSQNVLEDIRDLLPPEFESSRVYGARCIFRPISEAVSSILSSPSHPSFVETIESIFTKIADFLNTQHGKIKLTPDFGRYANLADILARFTDHSLGIRCEAGGCGGKSSYTTTGMITAYEEIAEKGESKFTLIGAAGALGSEFYDFLTKQKTVKDLAVADLVFEDNPSKFQNKVLRSQYGKFTDECLERGGIIVATTVGNEMCNSNWKIMPERTIFFAAHNLALPNSNLGIELAKEIAKRNILLIPGQILTLGGALTSRVEWYARKHNSGAPFDKSLAHEIVKRVTKFCLKETIHSNADLSPFESMLGVLET